jgi:uncharacterized protein (TIGR00725 family)
MKLKPRIGIVGGSVCTEETYQLAKEIGREIGKRGAYLVTGGVGGVMEAACIGAKEAGGTTIGILPGDKFHSANPWVDIPIVTGLSHGRNIIIVRSCDVIIAISGSYGTLSEIAFALKLNVPIIGFKSWNIDDSILKATSASEAVALAFQQIHH